MSRSRTGWAGSTSAAGVWTPTVPGTGSRVSGGIRSGRLEGLCWIAVALALVGDVATTLVGIRLGLVESNPVARGALAVGGPVAMIAVKAGAVGVGLACRPLLPRAYARIVPACLAGPWLAATVYNLSLLAIAL